MIALASMLICAVVNLAFSAQRSMIDAIVETSGDNHAVYSNITKAQAEVISQQKEVARADMFLYPNGWWEPADGKKASVVTVYSSQLGSVAGYGLTYGRPPVAENEAVIPPHVADFLGIEPIVGAQFDMFFHTFGGEEIPFRFTVSGILEQKRLHAAMNSYMMFISESLALQLDHSRDLFVRFKPLVEPYGTAGRIARTVGMHEDDVRFNVQYMQVGLQATSGIAFAAAVLLILCVAGALVIYNAYNLSITKRIRQYGLLTVIGASKKQVQRCVELEALYCSLFGLPPGLLAGTLLGYWGINALSTPMGIPIDYLMTPLAYLLSAAVTMVMVYFGVRQPARKASSVAPVEAVSFSDAPGEPYERKALDNITISSLSKINMSRAKGRTIGTITSLALSGALFLGFATVAFSMRDSIGTLAGQMVQGDITVEVENFYRANNPDPLSHGLTEIILGLEGITRSTTVMAHYLWEELPAQYAQQAHFDALYKGAVAGLCPDTMLGILDKVYDGNPELADFDVPGNVIAVMPSPERVASEMRRFSGYRELLADYYTGGSLSFDLTDHLSKPLGLDVTFNIIGLVYEDDITTYKRLPGYNPVLYTLQSNFAALGLSETYNRIILETDETEHDALYQTIYELCAYIPGLTVRSFSHVSGEMSRLMAGVIVIVLFMLSVIALNGILNLATSTMMGIEQRKKELGVLMAIGLSRKGVKKLLTFEGVRTSAICLSFSVFCGFILGIGLFILLVRGGADYLHFAFPFWPLIALCLVVGLVPYAVTSAAVRRLGRTTIVELLGRQT